MVLVLTPKRRAKSILLVLAQRIIALECELVAHQQSTTKAFFKVLAIPIHIWLPLHITSYCF
jgi:hypothetical protein